MFKKPLELKLDTTDVAVNHTIVVSPNTIFQTRKLVAQVGTTVMLVGAGLACVRVVELCATKLVEDLMK